MTPRPTSKTYPVKQLRDLEAEFDRLTAQLRLIRAQQKEDYERAEKAEAEVERLREAHQWYDDHLASGLYDETVWGNPFAISPQLRAALEAETQDFGEGSRSGGPSDSRAESQAGLNGPSGSPTSLPEAPALEAETP